ncbi:MAG: hypothetical protein GY696_33105 [Gammaproteobacteria bacterium]|nr:hypothetical protein [Gammaproteobacteria bacterium]
MRDHSYNFRGVLLAAAVIWLAPLAIFDSAEAKAANCADVPTKNHVSRLGGPNAFAEGKTVNSLAQLQDLFKKYADDLAAVLDSQGLSELAGPLFSAVSSGSGISESAVKPGDKLEWMAWRRGGKGGRPTVSSPVCMATSESYDSYNIDVAVDEGGDIVTYSIVVPKICLNMALAGVNRSKAAAKPVAKTAAVAPAVAALWTLRPVLGFLNMDEMLDSCKILDDGTIERINHNFDNGYGAGIGLEYHLSDRIGLESTLFYAKVDEELMYDLDDQWGMAEGDTNALFLTLGPNFHFTDPGSRVDFYAGPFIGYADIDDSEYSSLGNDVRISYDTNLLTGIMMGADFAMSNDSPWKFHTDLRVMNLEADVEDTDHTMHLDPIIFAIGLARTF